MFFAVFSASSPSFSVNIDSDQDGLSDATEIALGYAPHFKDSNAGGMPDFYDAFNEGVVDESGELIDRRRAFSRASFARPVVSKLMGDSDGVVYLMSMKLMVIFI